MNTRKQPSARADATATSTGMIEIPAGGGFLRGGRRDVLQYGPSERFRLDDFFLTADAFQFRKPCVPRAMTGIPSFFKNPTTTQGDPGRACAATFQSLPPEVRRLSKPTDEEESLLSVWP